jgi:3D (Asp-Asp-Asp) domain-containing protein
MSSRLFVAIIFLFSISIMTSCSTSQKMPREQQRTLSVTATAFNSLPKQGQGDPSVGAWGDRITPGMNAIAVSADLLSIGLNRGTRVRIEGLSNEYVVLDRMPAKWKKRIDIYMGNDVKAARAWGRREVNIFWSVPDESNR